ncbi:MAG TPA: hypothetical protein DCY13_20015 [Verrucomicrobiales bacterium]|nr:hypothetical protein [Verrucomicrobiales bacterium]
MKMNKWTAALASAGVLGGVTAQAEESPVMTALASTTISGYVDVSAHWNLDRNRGAVPNFGKGEVNKSDGFNLNVVDLTISKPLDESQWAAGYTAELWFGPDAVGYNPTAYGDGNESFAVKQAYVELRAPAGNGLDFKVGVFDTIIGYEYANNNLNPNYTRSWGWTIEPTQHTGVLMSYEFNEVLSASAGIANTFNAGINTRAHASTVEPKKESDKTVMGALSVTLPESTGFLEGSTLYVGSVYGFDAGTQGISGGNRVNYYAGATFNLPVDGLSLGLAWDYAGAEPSIFGGGAIDGYHQNVFGVYLSHQTTEKLSLHARGEFAKGNLIYTQTDASEGEIWSAVGTIQYDLWDNVLSRLEVRYDNAEDGVASLGWSKRDEVLVALNLIYNF